MKYIRNIVVAIIAVAILAFGLTTSAVAATAPTNVKAVSTTETSIRLGWTGYGGTYKVYKNGVTNTAWNGTNTEETVSGLTKCTTYTFQIEAVNSTGAAKSAPVNLKTTGACPTTPAPTPTPTPAPVPVSGVPAPGNWSQVFGDEFNDTVVDSAKWRTNWYAEGSVMNKVGTYSRNVSENNGTLNLKLESTSAGALVHTDFTGGYKFPVGSFVQASVFFPTVNGVCANWPAFWVSSAAKDGWPSSGEHDIAEVLSGQLTVNYHSPSGAHNKGAIAGSWCGSWHTYGIHRKATTADVYWDGVKVKSYSTDDNGKPEIIIFNMGMSSKTLIGGVMKVDWVRAYAPTP